MNRNIQEVLKVLGKEYTVKNIDGEDCVYRDLGEYDIEISGCDEKRKPFSVYVWKKSPKTIVYRKQGIKTLPRLCGELNYVMELYRAKLQGVPFPEEV
ncbi:MAG: hypothetical protein IMW92_12300 [Bacillales bacterium]|nr:hypothetical protein [Bacillales bacterium]